MADDMSEDEWRKWEKQHAEDVLKRWERYAPNMTWDNVIDYNAVHPRYMADMCRNYVSGNPLIVDPVPSQSGRFRPLLELAGHRTPVKGLYATGSGWHPYPSAHSCQGYNCYKVLAEDFGLTKPWENNDYPW
jgi:phytoene dehydrogenase-like protein